MHSIQPDKVSLSHPTLFLTIGIVLVAMFADVSATYLFSQPSNPFSLVFEMTLCSALGALVAQPCLLSVWATLLAQRSVTRVAFSFFTLCAVTTVYLAALASTDKTGMPIEVILIVFGVSFGLYLLASIPIGLFRWKSGHALSRLAAVEESDQSIQFGIRHIFILMTVVAVLLPVAKTLFGKVTSEPDAPWLAILSFLALYSLLVLGAFLSSIACVFSPRRVPYYIALVVYTSIMPIPVAYAMAYFSTIFNAMEISYVINGICFVTCFSLTMIAVLSMYRLIGYRLRPVGS
jgi:hypothetical protein